MKHTRNQAFFGQQDVLEQIDAALLRATQASDESATALPRSLVMCGLGGIGKTELAIEYMHSRKGTYDAIFWVNADAECKLSAGFAEIAQVLGLKQEGDIRDDVATREIVKGWFSNPVARKPGYGSQDIVEAWWLLILDNADDPDLLDDFWPNTGGGAVLVTTRNPVARDSIYIQSTIDVPVMTTEVAGRFIKQRSGREQERNSCMLCAHIADTLGGLPFAIVQMAMIIRRRHLSLKDFIEYYEEDAKRLQETSIRGLTYNQTLASVWAVEQLSPIASSLLKVLSVLDPDQIPEELLTEGSRDVKLPNYPNKKSAHFDARAELIRSSLIVRNFELEVLRIHRLVQDVVRQKLSKNELSQVFNAAVTLMTAVWPFSRLTNRNNTDRYLICDKYFPHISQWKHLFTNMIDSGDLGLTIASAALFNEASWFMVEKGDVKECRAFAILSQKVLSHLKETPDTSGDEYNKQLADCHQYRCIAAIDLGDGKQAIWHGRQWLALLIGHLENCSDAEDAINVANAYCQIGLAYSRADNDKAAIESFKQSLDSFAAVRPDDQIAKTWPAINLSLLYATKGQSAADEADKVLSPVLQARDGKFGRDDVSTFDALLSQSIKIYGNLLWFKPEAARASWKKGRLKAQMGNHVEADELLRRAMRLRKELRPDDSRSEVDLSDRDWDILIWPHQR
ncbi:MAG: hypothetical protein M1821_006964 [Bathelium mastoideum]|nr:MAG: hypothetical protein M1821_006964 [Bathelium mastoideum]